MKRLRVFTWHVHGNYLYYLSHIGHTIYLPFNKERSPDYAGKTPGFNWGVNVHEVSIEEVFKLKLDCIIFQRPSHYFIDQFKILSANQRKAAKIYLEHDPPREHPTDNKHWVDDKSVLLVHVTHFNELMWDSNQTQTKVIIHGVVVKEGIKYKGDKESGLVIVNNMHSRGRRLGADIFMKLRQTLPLTLIGMNSELLGGLGEVSHDELNEFESRFRFFFNPIRYTSLGLSVCEAMMVGLPVVGFSTTEMAAVIKNGENGFCDTDCNRLQANMQRLLKDFSLARHLGEGAKKYAREHFNINRFVSDWNDALRSVCG